MELFIGRQAEVERLRKKVARSASGRLEVGFLVGERGIGKSSLASVLRVLAEREDQVLGLHTFLGGVSTMEEMARRVFDRLLKDSIEKPWHKKVRELLGNHVREVGLFGISVEFGASPKDLRRMVHDFVPGVRNLINRLKGEKTGILLVLDDINGLASSPEFANWLKSLVDEIATSHEPCPLCLLLVGVEERRQELVRSQPSFARVFDLAEIMPWSEEETRTFYRNAFSKVGMECDEVAVTHLAVGAGGLPVLAHEIGDAAFNLDTDDRIDEEDAWRAVWQAAEIVGRKHLQPQVLQAIRSEKYRSILRKLAKKDVGFLIQRSDVLRRLSAEEERVFDNFLRRMTKLGVVTKDVERGRGAYRFTNLLHYLYFKMEASRADERQAW